MKATFKWTTTPRDAFGRFMVSPLKHKQREIEQAIEAREQEMIEWMRDNATWQDQTGRARLLLDVATSVRATTVLVKFKHGVYYGKYLEKVSGGYFAILGKAVDYWLPELMETTQKVLTGNE